MNNVMWQLHMQQLGQLNGSFSKPLQRQSSAGGNSGRGGSRQHTNTPYQHPGSQMNSGGRNQRFADEPSSGRHQQHSHSRDNYHQQKDRSGNRQHDSRGGSRHHDDRSSSRGYQDNRWRRYWDTQWISVKTSQICGKPTKKRSWFMLINSQIHSGCLYRILPVWRFNN